MLISKIHLYFSFISGISLLGTPTELYVYGTAYLFSFVGTLIMSIVVFYTFLPVLHDLQLTSAYEVKTLKLFKLGVLEHIS